MKTYKFKINGNGYEVAINSVEGQTASVTVNGTPYTVELEEAPAAPVQAVPVQAAPVQAAPAAAPKAAPAASGAGKAVTSPLPGVIIAVKVNVGDTVNVKVIGVKDGKISLSIKALEEKPVEEEVVEEKIEIPVAENIGTSLGDLFKNIKL